MNLETGVLRALGHRLTSAALGRLSRPAPALLAGVAARSRWTAETLRRTCARTGDEGALAELIEQSALLRANGSDLVVDPTFLAIAGGEVREPNPAWLRAASEVMAADGDVVAATDLALAAGAVEDAERLLGAHETRLLQTASSGDLDRWLATVSERAPTLGGGSAPCGRGSWSGWRPRRRRRRRAAASGRPLACSGRPRNSTVRALLRALAAIGAFGLGWLLPLPEGLTRGGLITLAAIIATVPLLVANVLPDYVVMLFLTLALVCPAWCRPRTSSAASPLPPAHDLHAARGGRGVARSGLMFRLVLLSLQRLPPVRPPELVLCLTGVLMRRGLSSGSTGSRSACRSRAASRTPWDSRPKPGSGRRRVDDVLHVPPDGRAVPDRDVHRSHRPRPPAGRRGPDHLVALVLHRALPPFVVIGRDVPGAALPLQAAQDGAGQPRAVRLQQALLGPLTRSEIWSAAVLVLLIVGFATPPYHGIAPAGCP